MPSLEQLRYEALAKAVDRATRPFLLSILVGREPIIARVELSDGREFDFRLQSVDVDGGMLVGRDRRRRAMVIPLSEVQRVCWRRYAVGRTAAVCGVATAACTVWSAMASWGPVVGLGVGGVISVALNQLNLLTRWVVLYDRDSPS